MHAQEEHTRMMLENTDLLHSVLIVLVTIPQRQQPPIGLHCVLYVSDLICPTLYSYIHFFEDRDDKCRYFVLSHSILSVMLKTNTKLSSTYFLICKHDFIEVKFEDHFQDHVKHFMYIWLFKCLENSNNKFSCGNLLLIYFCI